MLQQATMVLTDEQEEAVSLLRQMQDAEDQCGVAVIEGYAGCGKTSAVAHWLIEHARGQPVAVAAPTNKAVGVLSGKAPDCGATFGTIHSLLGLRAHQRLDGTLEFTPDGRNRLVEFDLCIIDECSMIGHEMFNRLLAGRGRCKLVFVGDPAQLPPVGESISPTFTSVQRRVTMRTIVRQAAGNPIIRWSMLIRDAIQRGQRAQLADLAADLGPGDDDAIQIAPGGAATATSLALSAMQAGLEQRILAYRNVDVDHYNTACHYGRFGNGPSLVAGEPVMCNDQFKIGTGQDAPILRNSEELTVVDAIDCDDPSAIEAKLLRDDGSTVTVRIARDSRAVDAKVRALFAEYRRLKQAADSSPDPQASSRLRTDAKNASLEAWSIKARYAPVRHAYALTVHKSQGSTFDAVVIDWASLSYVQDAQEFNRLLYVAVTRPSNYLVVIAP